MQTEGDMQRKNVRDILVALLLVAAIALLLRPHPPAPIVGAGPTAHAAPEGAGA